MLLSVFRKFENNHTFTEEESWLLFRLAAIGEACGWSLLIIGISVHRYFLPANGVPVLLAGRIHGMLFSLYALASIGLYPTLHWSRKRMLVALMASVPPYGSLLFERWAAHQRQVTQFHTYSCCVALATLSGKL